VEPIRVNKAALIDTLRANRSEHQDLFDQATVVYKARAEQELQRRLDDIRAGNKINLIISLPVPENHTEDYDRIIQMLEMSLDEEIMLSEADAAVYVLNQWGWMRSFTTNTTSYLVQ
jgi:hypothetical protein